MNSHFILAAIGFLALTTHAKPELGICVNSDELIRVENIGKVYCSDRTALFYGEKSDLLKTTIVMPHLSDIPEKTSVFARQPIGRSNSKRLREYFHKLGWDFGFLANQRLLGVNDKGYELLNSPLNRVGIPKKINRGDVWQQIKDLEKRSRERLGGIISFAGVARSNGFPERYYKVLYHEKSNSYIAFILSVSAEMHTVDSTLSSLDCVEHYFGDRVLPNMKYRAQLSNTKATNLKLWASPDSVEDETQCDL